MNCHPHCHLALFAAIPLPNVLVMQVIIQQWSVNKSPRHVTNICLSTVPVYCLEIGFIACQGI